MKLYPGFIVLLIISIIGCSHNAPTIAFVFPDGFTGMALVAEDETNGVDLPFENGQYNIEIPKNGKIAVKTLKPFTEWHKVIVQYESGKSIPYETATGDADVELYGLPFVPEKGGYFFLGTKADCDAVSKRYDFDKLPLGGIGQHQ